MVQQLLQVADLPAIVQVHPHGDDLLFLLVADELRLEPEYCLGKGQGPHLPDLELQGRRQGQGTPDPGRQENVGSRAVTLSRGPWRTSGPREPTVVVAWPTQAHEWSRDVTWPKAVLVQPLLCASLLVMLWQSFNPFLYFQF